MADTEVADAPTSTDLVIVEAQQRAVAIFTDEKQYSEFYERVKKSVADFVPDVTTDKGRREIASVAFRVTKAKTTLDKAGFALTEEWRKKTAAVNASRKKMTTELDALAAEVRRPLTEWEEREAERQRKVEGELARFRNAGVVADDETAADVERRGRELHAEQLDPELYQDRLDEAAEAKAAAVQVLARAMHRLRQEEADRAELERLRREAAEREEAERIAREAREKEERERLAREAEERAKVEAEERRKAEIAEAADRARVEEAERVRREEQERHEAELAKERAAAEEERAEAERLRREKEEREAWELKENREREAREADERHRKAVIDEIIADLHEALQEEADSVIPKAVANAIAAGTIRHVSVKF
jgi:hypothetical protein